MNPRRRALMLGGPCAPVLGNCWAASPSGAQQPAVADEDAIRVGRALDFPRDHGAHPGARIEWWYATGWLAEGGAAAAGAGALFGFQLTFFRSRTGLAEALPGRFAPRQLLFAHAALSDIAAGRHVHAQRIARWSGDDQAPAAHARRGDTAVALAHWTLARQGPTGASRYAAALHAPEAGFALALQLACTQPLLLQGQAGHSRKGPLPAQASHYYSQPQLAVNAQLQLGRRRLALHGVGWLDHEWSDELMPPSAVGWDWIGINLADGGALTAFVLRQQGGGALWAGGSHRPAGGEVRVFGADEVIFTPLREWRSPQSGARYPVHWRIRTPAGEFELRALLDAQELDSRASTGAVYWEGLAELLQAAPAGGHAYRVGLGYLEMTGRLSPLRLG